MGVAPPELGQLDGWESSGEEERERWGWCRRSRRSSVKGRAAPKDGDDATAPTGCCIRLWPMGNCPPPPRSTSTSSASTHGGTFAPSPVVACACCLTIAFMLVFMLPWKMRSACGSNRIAVIVT
jgi:hypothetical protein